MRKFPKIIIDNWRLSLVYSAVALLILWPLLGPGYILTLDMVFTPNLKLPDTVSSSYLFRAVLHVFSLAIPSDIIQKILLFAILALSGIGMHRLVRSFHKTGVPADMTQWGAYAGGFLYMINPFTYSRFMAGQYSVLLGYCLLPFFVVALLRLLKRPTNDKAILLTLIVVLISIVSIHTLGLAFVIAIIALGQTLWRERFNKAAIVRLAKYIGITSLMFFLASSYWLVPLVQGSSNTASAITTFKNSDQSAFETGGEGVGGKIMHVLRLQGFWGERNDLFLLPQDRLALWGLVVILVWGLVFAGGIIIWRQKREAGILVLVSAVVAIMLAAGVGLSWLSTHIPFFAGYREPQKFVALVALGYSVLVSFAVPWLLLKFKSKTTHITVGITLSLILVGFTPVMFRGFDSQLTPRHYPSDWTSLNQRLNTDTDDFQVLFLPWHLYTRYAFTGRIIASPAEGFFDKPFLVSDNPELENVAPAIADSQKQLLTTTILPQAPKNASLGHQLSAMNVKYIVLTKDADFKDYRYLDGQSDLTLLSDTSTLKLYLNTAYRKEN